MPIARLTVLAPLVFLVAACADASGPAPVGSVGTATQAAAGGERWAVLFNGEDASAWRTFGEDALRPQWQVVDGALTLTEAGGGDITTGVPYDDFELEVEWRVEPGGNSGIFYGVDADETVAAWKSGIEYQLLDDALHDNGEDPATSAGAVFGLYPAPRGAVSPGGEWNTSRLTVRGDEVVQELNGVETARFEVGSTDFRERVAASKFAKHDGFGRSAQGLVVLQDHKDEVAFRSVRIRPL